MDHDVIGAAAAVEALKLTAAENQSQGGGRPGGGRGDSEYSNAPPGGLTPNKPAGGKKPSYDEDEDEDEAPPASKGGMQDKIVGVSSGRSHCIANMSLGRLHWQCRRQENCSIRRMAEVVGLRLERHKVLLALRTC